MPDLDTFGFFYKTATDTDDTYDYNSQEYAEFVKLLISDGVAAHYGNQFRATLSGSNIIVQSGAVVLNGYHGLNKGDVPLTPQLLPSGDRRADYVVLKVSTNARKLSLELFEGAVTTGTPVLPEIPEPTDLLAYLPIWSYTVAAAGISVLTDCRIFNLSGSNFKAGTAVPSAVTLRPGEVYFQVAST
ncbi:MAG: hypothetical protein FWF10_07995 [Clostridiales bacterium]|nr:hypothetical protein [Clostridiales bacterium]